MVKINMHVYQGQALSDSCMNECIIDTNENLASSNDSEWLDKLSLFFHERRYNI